MIELSAPRGFSQVLSGQPYLVPWLEDGCVPTLLIILLLSLLGDGDEFLMFVPRPAHFGDTTHPLLGLQWAWHYRGKVKEAQNTLEWHEVGGKMSLGVLPILCPGQKFGPIFLVVWTVGLEELTHLLVTLLTISSGMPKLLLCKLFSLQSCLGRKVVEEEEGKDEENLNSGAWTPKNLNSFNRVTSMCAPEGK